MKSSLSTLINLTFVGGVVLSLAVPLQAQPDPRKEATVATKGENLKLTHTLPFSDKTDFDNARKGLLAPLPKEMLKGDAGETVWDPAKYDFTSDKAAPDTVNPSLWRQSQLINISGLFEVVPGIYQVRNLDLANMTIIEGKKGITIVDPMGSSETAKYALELYYSKRDKKPIVAVIYTHSHVDHYGGVRGVIDEADVKSGKIKLYAPEGFMEAAVAENIMAGNVMSRRASYMYGNLLKPDEKGQVGAGLGTTTSTGTVTLIEPNEYITKTGQKEKIDGLTYEFMMAPGSEAPSEMLWYIEEKKAISAAEDATHTLHNTYSLRGAKIREPLPWSKYLNQALTMWGDKVEVIFASHHWPTWGNQNVNNFLRSQRDLYRYINDETLHQANQGKTMREIAEDFKLPDSLAHTWANRGYYGSVYHDVAATYVLYLGWYDGNPATLQELPPVAESKKYVEFMGGADAVLKKARESFDKGEYRWVAQVVHHVVFADPANKAARALEADALEQLGYQAESGPWRNFYLAGAQELRNGVAKLPTPNTASPDTVKAMSLEMIFDYWSVRLNRAKAGSATAKLNFDFGTKGEQYYVELENGVINHSAGVTVENADTSIKLSKATLTDIMLQKVTLDNAIKSGDVKITGSEAKLKELLSYFDNFEFWFNIVEP